MDDIKSTIVLFDQEMIAAREYWVSKLSQVKEISNLRLDNARPVIYSDNRCTFELQVEEDSYQKLVKLTNNGSFLISVVLMAVLKICIYKYTSSNMIVVGSPSRRYQEASASPINALAIVDPIDGQMTFREFLLNVRQSLLEAHTHQQYPFDYVIRDVGLEHITHKCPLFDISLELQDIHNPLPDVKNDIALFFVRSSDSLSGRVTFNSDIFHIKSMQKFINTFLSILQAALTDTETYISALPSVIGEERKQLLVEWNQTEQDYPRELCIHQLIEEQVSRTPEAVAIVSGETALTYQVLEQQATLLANKLVRLNVGPEVCVGLCMERSIEMVIGLLAILKSGGAYVPLEPGYPTERLAFMIQDAAVRLVLTQEKYRERLPRQEGYEKICLDSRDWKETETKQQVERVANKVRPEHLAYVMYTSGSTGVPKGVMVPHRGVVNYLWWCIQAYQIAQGVGSVLHSPLSFDLTVTSLFAPLLVGRSVTLIESRVGAESLLQVLEEQEKAYSLLKLTPAHLDFLQEVWQGRQQRWDLHVMVIGGEALRQEKINFWRERAQGVQLINEYGPTETVVGCSVYNATQDKEKVGPVPIGRPIANTQLYVLDHDQQVVPIGVGGELYIGGDGLARGYLNRPALTAERFIPDGWSGRAGARLYRTGDLVRYREDGNVEYLGRTDHQVKIRGFRVEVGEVEAVLEQHALVQEAIVLAQPLSTGLRQLIGYIVAVEGQAVKEEALRVFLQHRLPDYMIPSRWVWLKSLPLSANGKVDRHALATLAGETREDRGESRAARTPVEELLVGIWSEVLARSSVGIDEDFFALGGHSLLATQVLSRVRDALQTEVPLQALFQHPTVAAFAQQVQQYRLSEQHRLLPPFVKRGPHHEHELPLSFAQQRLWFLHQLEPESPFYNVSFAVRIEGELHQEALVHSLNELLQRHEVLRTTFGIQQGRPFQRIAAHAQIVLQQETITAEKRVEQEELIQQRLRQEEQTPFDLDKGPLVRGLLLHLSPTEQVFMLSLHHIVADGWSLSILFEELSQLYAAYRQGQPSPFPPVALQYADVALWQREWLQGAVLAHHLAYWREQLAHAPTLLSLPTDHPRPLLQSYRGASERFVLSAELSEQVRILSRRAGVTLYMLLLAAFQVLLARYSGQQDILVGSPIANRTTSELEGMIGFFANTLVMRTRIREESRFEEVVRAVREVALEAYAHQDIPFEYVVEELHPQRSLSHSPLFQVVFTMQNATPSALRLADLNVESMEIDWQTAKFDLTMGLKEREERLEGFLEYNTDLFDRSTITRLLSHFQVLLQAIVADPQQVVAELPLLTQAEQHQLLVEWNATWRDYPQECSIQQLFEEQVERSPEAIALVFDDKRLTYGELNWQANQLAHYLQTLGVGPDVLVGFCLERSIEMVVGVLAILKAGGAYLPLDTSYPKERLAFMLQDAQASVVITTETMFANFSTTRTQLICLEQLAEQLASYPPENPNNRAYSHNLAYVMYTSGSTGKPKGVAVTHQNVVRLVKNTTYAQFSSEEVFLQFAPIAFDASTFEIWGALLNGASLVLFPSSLPLLRELGEMLQCERVTTLWLTAGLFHQMVDEQLEALYSVRQLLAGGDVLSVSHVQKVVRELPNCRLIDGYGPTEGTTFSCCYLIDPQDRPGESVPIGRPVANTRLYVLDHDQQVVPIGVGGELYIGGDGLARGYLNRPALTAERFIPDGWSGRAGARLYRTGDLVRYREDGNVEYLGRTDQQVKIRGFRVEVGEVEAVLEQHALVQEAVVLAQPLSTGLRQLIGYIVAVEGQAVKEEALRAFLQHRLPDYMIPSRWVWLKSLPLSANGKVDRHALATLAAEAREDRGESRAARTPVEELLVGIWSQVLVRSSVGIDEDFFALGGHSLLATQVLSRVRDALQTEVPLQALFQHPTVAAFAQQVQQHRLSEQHRLLPPFVKRGPHHEHELPLSFAQQRLWFLHQLEPESPFYNASFAVRIEGELHQEALERSLSEIVQRHEALRTTFGIQHGRPFQRIAAAAPLMLHEERLEEADPAQQEARVQQWLTQEAQHPFDLEQGPLLRVRLLRVGERERVLVVSLHHIVADGWSLSILFEELSQLYAAYRQGNPSPLPPVALQYVDVALWQREWLQGAVLAHHLAYWREQLAHAPTLLSLPTDHPRPLLQSYRGASERFVLSVELSEQVRVLSQRAGVTLYMLLLAAFQVLLARYSGQQDILVGSPIANRTSSKLEGMIGFFANTLVMRTRIRGESRFEEVVRAVREVTLEAYAHQDIPFEYVVEELHPQRSLSHSPLFQVVFTMQNATPSALRLADLNVESMEIDWQTAKFDLTMGLKEREERLEGFLEYNTDLFERATITRLLSHFQVLLQAIVADPGQSVFALPLLTEQERMQVLLDWNRTQVPLPEPCLHTLIEEQVERSPDVIAIVFEEQQLSYAELNRRANLLAHQLLRSGVKPGDSVGIYMERSLEMITSLVATLKVGGVYVPLELSNPSERLAFILQDAQIAILISLEAFRSMLLVSAPHIIYLDTNWSDIVHNSEQNLSLPITTNFSAYIIYTSGSTGIPRGVCVSHQAIKRLICNTDYLQIGADDCIAHASNSAFDAATFEIWGALVHGARLAIISKNITLSPQIFVDCIREQGISALFLTTALFDLVARDIPSAFSSVQHVLFGGETVDPRWVRKVLRNGPPERLLHVYGPTETTTFASWYLVEHVDESATTIPIGRPIANTQIYILDSRQNPVPIGVYGELYIGGDGLANGYLRNPERTAERFIPHPFSSQPGARLYRTGDQARWQSDGMIEFLGRTDHQVKMRGYRIELGEIEFVLAQYSKVRDVVVLALEEFPGDKRLVAYVTLNEEEPVCSSAELRLHVQQFLPEYMVPSVFVILEAFPITANGKVDRHALATLAGETREDRGESRAARTPVEELLVGIWSEVLARSSVGTDEDFFALGGHSLLATQVLSRVRDALQTEVPLQALFQHPTVAGFAQQVQQYRLSEQHQLLPPLVKRGPQHEHELPLSFAQQRLWFLHQLEPESPFYNIAFAVRIEGELHQEALERSLSEIVQRHEALRTTFGIQQGRAFQRIAAATPLMLHEERLEGTDPAQQEAGVQQWLTQEAQQPFDLEHGPLLRVRLLRVGERERVLIVSLHHIVADGWSLSILFEELSQLYAAYRQGNPSPLPPIAVQYADVALWQREWLQGAVLAHHLAYWKEQLAHAPTLLSLPTDHPRPLLQSYRGASELFVLSAELSEQLRMLSRRAGVTLYMLLLAAFEVLLARYSGQQDILVGSPIANRTTSELEGMIGFFANTLVMRTRIRGESRFEEVVRAVREVTLEAYAHQDIPFEYVVEELHPQRSLSHSPLFQVLFTFQNTTTPVLDLPGLTVHLLDIGWMSAKFDLTLGIRETGSSLEGALEYNIDLFERSTITRLLSHFRMLLESLVSDPHQRVGDVPLLSPYERDLMLYGWNQTRRDYLQTYGVHELIEQQAARTPDALALVFGDTALSYGVLEQRVNQLAHYLHNLEVGPDVLVGLYMERSIEMVVGLLAVLKAGGAYVPLDPTNPGERIAHILQDAHIPVLLMQQRLFDTLPECDTHLIRVDSDWSTISQESGQPLSVSVHPDNLAYVMYTSGSTGRPKGVPISHRSVTNFMLSMKELLKVSEKDIMLAITTLSFDIAALELLLPLSVGARIDILSREAGFDIQLLKNRLALSAASIMQATPVTWNLLLKTGWEGDAGLKILCGGETLPPSLADQLSKAGMELWNLYGPTETTIWSTADLVSFEDTKVSLGRPLANTQIYVLDAHLQPVPIGIVGEIYIGGVGIARGYLQRPDLTAERFLPDPFSELAGGRFYRTGDLARYRSDGSLQFIGRVDSQVKLRGFRIELEEIEAVLLEHTEVREAVVLVREDVPEDRRLVVYVVSDQERKLSRDDLKTHARKRLPEYMVPSAFVIMSSLPLTANGKINRRMLPVPEQPLETTYVAPQTELEHHIASVWQEVLHLERASTHENFFDLGGHSLLLAQVHSRLRAALKADLSMIALFQYPTISSLAKYMTQEPAEEHTPRDDSRFKVHKSSRRQRSRVRQAAWKNKNNMRSAE